MSGFVDLHCHYVANIDDGVRTIDEAQELLRGLGRLGFERVFATPHMRPGMFDHTRGQLESAFANTLAQLDRAGLPELALGCEHTFDNVVFDRIVAGEGLPYPPGKAILIEFYDAKLPLHLPQLLAQLRRSGLTPVIAHPERVPAFWEDPASLEPLLDVGCAALLDTCALVGKYGRRPEKAARQLLELGFYDAACSDAHRPSDLALLEKAMNQLHKRYGQDELDELFRHGPHKILEGAVVP
ncbi:MAG TPA: CpsB/CapC family capsule biosynthesis tyrosine phosphatase [Polyangiaceae bacterium]|nr:CpsB/CapC family capsule biosynthesis tyrosine phosphatase [Polyangiaceae bacterium]